ncbi:enoyl-CoA hydratase/isomerase family protein [uncultured Williamsia sp.]|uniref:enoyl-CoA hydratase/isomerase family protein n=1 Tax=uncultured Williamsia sp. TaxID=259311 RepID=UPI00261AE1D8|nr:enoyl-CoA hydratase/isomerase family protein [uncultured Williamsia sp.]
MFQTPGPVVVDLDDRSGGLLDPPVYRGGPRIGVVSADLPEAAWGAAAQGCDVVYATPQVAGDRRWCVGVDDPGGTAARVVDDLARHPQAAAVLAQVLRAGEHVSVAHALLVESFAYSTLLGGPEFAKWLAGRGEKPAPPPASDPVLIDRDDDVLTIALNRPDRRNAYGAALRDALNAAIDVARYDSTVRAVHLRAVGSSFCSGGDLAEFGTTADVATAHVIRTAVGSGPRIAEIASTVTAFVHGGCVGAGIELPAMAGRVVMDPATIVHLPELSMGLIPGAGGTVSISRRIGRWRTFHLAATDEVVDPATALAWGLCDAVEAVRPVDPR